MLFSLKVMLTQVIKPCLCYLDLSSPELEMFLMAILMTNTDHQVGYSIYHISHSQHWDLWDLYLVNYPELASRVRGLASQHRFLDDPDMELDLNLGYATAIVSFLLMKQMAKSNRDSLTFEDMLTAWSTLSPATPAQLLSDNFNRLRQQHPMN